MFTKKQNALKLILPLALTIVHNACGQFNKFIDFSGALNGNNCIGGLISDGTWLYGITSGGGTNSNGTFFKIKTDGSGYAKLFDFADTATGKFPVGRLFSDGSFLYGTCSGGGKYQHGTVFKCNFNGTGFTKLLDFDGKNNGQSPTGSLISDGTYLFGMTTTGGTHDLGIVYRIKTDGKGYLKLLEFDGSANGMTPYGALAFDGTWLYGMTGQGGPGTYGTIFKIKSDGNNYAKIVDFSKASGAYPNGSLIVNGNYLYGMTTAEGLSGYGNVFKILNDGSGFISLHDFKKHPDGNNPKGSLILSGTTLFGTTFYGGFYDFGSIFQLNTSGNNYSVIFNFNDTAQGGKPEADLLYDGTYLYGTTTEGGKNDMGTLFRLGGVSATNFLQINPSIQLYPNPAQSILIIESAGPIHAIKITDISGKTIAEIPDLKMPRIELATAVYPNGMYFVHVFTASKIATYPFQICH